MVGVNIRASHNFFQMMSKDLSTSTNVRKGDSNMPVEAAGTDKGSKIPS